MKPEINSYVILLNNTDSSFPWYQTLIVHSIAAECFASMLTVTQIDFIFTVKTYSDLQLCSAVSYLSTAFYSNFFHSSISSLLKYIILWILQQNSLNVLFLFK